MLIIYSEKLKKDLGERNVGRVQKQKKIVFPAACQGISLLNFFFRPH